MIHRVGAQRQRSGAASSASRPFFFGPETPRPDSAGERRDLVVGGRRDFLHLSPVPGASSPTAAPHGAADAPHPAASWQNRRKLHVQGCYPARVQSFARTIALAGFGLLVACGHKPPYRVGEQPPAESLMQQTEPQLSAIAVPDAQITLDRVVRADLQLLAQTDARFRATVTKAGNELVTLAFSEDGYAMRYKLDEIPAGFYSGPADPCAVQAVLGVPLSYDGLVALVLGGAPIIEGSTLTKQKWDRKRGYEVLTLSGAGYVQELWFGWVNGGWVFAGGQLWEGSADSKGAWLFTFEHDKHEQVGGVLLPGRTKVRAPGKRRNHLIVLSYKDRNADPPWAKSEPGPSGDDGGDGGDGGDDGGWENSGDDGGWENSDDDGGWENSDDDGGWENSETPAEPVPDATPEESPAPPSGVLAAVLNAAGPQPVPAQGAAVPAVFTITANGLTDRGDLCR